MPSKAQAVGEISKEVGIGKREKVKVKKGKCLGAVNVRSRGQQ